MPVNEEFNAKLDEVVQYAQRPGAVSPGEIAAIDQRRAQGMSDFAKLVLALVEAEAHNVNDNTQEANRTTAAYALTLQFMGRDPQRTVAALRAAIEMFGLILASAWGGWPEALAGMQDPNGDMFPEESGLNGRPDK